MFVYKDGRFHLGKTSFALPKECIVDTLPLVESHNGFIIMPIDRSFRICVDFDMRGNEPYCGIKEDYASTEAVEEHLPFGVGWSIVMDYHKYCCRELCIPTHDEVLDEDGHLLNELDIHIFAENMERIEKAINSGIYKEFMNSISLGG